MSSFIHSLVRSFVHSRLHSFVPLSPFKDRSMSIAKPAHERIVWYKSPLDSGAYGEGKALTFAGAWALV